MNFLILRLGMTSATKSGFRDGRTIDLVEPESPPLLAFAVEGGKSARFGLVGSGKSSPLF